ncbi:hypothetical protein ABT354_16825 [Streptomyces sp. NPDC000594]|uniref:hypothetical protein n=1 Tax=Streptomyces sp. NPDC000594 TaxID=3154261 RepID=UPI003325F7AF
MSRVTRASLWPRVYSLAKQDAYPLKVLRLGNAYRVVATDLHRLPRVTLEP